MKDFISEARRLNSLCGQCRNIVPVDEVFEANGTACYVMEFLDGGSLADYVKKHGALSVGVAKKILKPVADAVAFLHSNSITHLDIKPGNIMFRSNGEPVLIDFGLAKHYDRRGNATTTVRTLAYSAGFSPAEQYVGLKQFSPQSDVYALAATFANMLTGKTPPEAIDLEFSLNDWSVCLPEEVRPAVVHAMAYSRKDRTLSVHDFVKELYGNDPSVVEKPVSQPAAEPMVESKTEVIGEGKKSTKKWWIIAACVAVAAVVGIVCAKFLSVGEDMEQKTESAPQLGSQTFTVNGVKFTMVPVEGGTFTMGATSEQGSDALEGEYPAHQVTLSDYYIGQTEVTQALWKAVMGSNPSDSKGDNLPVEQVSWDDCQVFIQKLNQLTGKQFRLPTESEWEYAARGGRKSRGYKYAGDNDIGLVAWYEDNSGNETHPVATKQANELGVYDMSGNVEEWCSDGYDGYQSSSQSDPQGPSSGSDRVGRGGSFFFDARYCRVSNREYYTPDFRTFDLGLRLSCKK